MEGTISQQTKLIDFLQAKMDQPAKKKKVGHQVCKGDWTFCPTIMMVQWKPWCQIIQGTLKKTKCAFSYFILSWNVGFEIIRIILKERMSLSTLYFMFMAFKIAVPVTVKGVIFFFNLRNWEGSRERFIHGSPYRSSKGWSQLMCTGLQRD